MLLSAAAALLAIAGCNPSSAQSASHSEAKPVAAPTVAATAQAPSPAAEGDQAHGHRPGSHGGLIVSIGLDSYHAEAVIESGGTLKFLMLGKDESRILEVETQKLKAYIKAAGAAEAVAVDLLPTPQEGDAEGKTSQFLAQLPSAMRGQEIDVTVPSIRINGERFRIGFTSRVESHGSEEGAMPSSVSASEERDLYLTPAGKYTLADIAANGNVTASQKFKGVISNHNLKPAAGDRICPVTLTKANSKFTWVIDGQSYEFCCPPCVDEYVKLAKEKPEELQPADSFVKK